jgi:hypothetical protein
MHNQGSAFSAPADLRQKRFKMEIQSLKVSTDAAVKLGKVVEKSVDHQRTISIIGLLIGLLCVVGGVLLFFAGISGSTSWTTKIIGFESKFTEAAPGAILFVVGIAIVWITKFDVTIGGK